MTPPALYIHIMRLRFLAFLLIPSAYADAVTVTVHTTVNAAASPTPPSTQYTSSSSFQRAIIDTHNFYRKEHNASALAWNRTSAAYAANWAGACNFKHSVSIYPQSPLCPIHHSREGVKTTANKT